MTLWISPPMLLFILPIVLWGLSYPVRLLQNYLAARRTGLPLVICPIYPHNPIWMLLCVPLRPYLRDLLSPSLFLRINISIYGWEFGEKYRPHVVYGKNFVYVTCGSNEINIAEPALAAEVLRRTPREFVQTTIGTRIMRVFGDNLITVNGERWAKQRKLIASNVNERISGVVWEESARQAREMLEIVGGGKERNNVAEGLKVVAINVLARAGYGLRSSWNGHDEEVSAEKNELWQSRQEGMALNYIEATRLAVDHVLEVAVLPAWLCTLSWMPKGLQRIGHAITEFPVHTKGMLERERQKPSEKVNLLSMLVKESDSQVSTSEEKGEKQIGTGAGLSEDEIMGNLFVFTAAGFDTTANTMAYAMVILAAYPHLQEWLCEEIDEVLEGKSEDLSYSDIFPRLIRMLALMQETLRVYSPLTHIAKMAGSDLTMSSSADGPSYFVPKDTIIYINVSATHMNPDVYGLDASEFRPSRWISSQEEKESLVRVEQGAFLPWSAGPRNCPGYKMSQVEFVSVFVTIFRRFRVEVVRQVGETAEQASKRVVASTEDSQSRLTLQMNHPKDVVLRFVKR